MRSRLSVGNELGYEAISSILALDCVCRYESEIFQALHKYELETWSKSSIIPLCISITLPCSKHCNAVLLLKGGAHMCCINVSSIHEFTQSPCFECCCI